jgi:hypothetical protein
MVRKEDSKFKALNNDETAVLLALKLGCFC